MWSQILILIVSVLSAFIFAKRTNKKRRDIKITGVLAYLFTFLVQFILLIDLNFKELISEYVLIAVLVLSLTILLMTIRWLRPEIARYPYGFVFIPSLILLFYPVIQGTDAITNIIQIMIQISAIVVLIFLVIAHYDHIKRGLLITISIISYVIAFIIYWILPEFFSIKIWMWESFIALGMISTSFTFPNLLTEKYKTV